MKKFHVVLIILLIITGCSRELSPEQKEENFKLAKQQALALCTQVKTLLNDNRLEEPLDDENYLFIRKLCFNELEEWTTEACREICIGAEAIAYRKLSVFILRPDIERGCPARILGRVYDLEKFGELCRKEGIRSGREHRPELPKGKVYKLCVVIRPGYGVTAQDVAPLAVEAMKRHVYRLAILPPFTEEEEKLFFQAQEQYKNR